MFKINIMQCIFYDGADISNKVSNVARFLRCVYNFRTNVLVEFIKYQLF